MKTVKTILLITGIVVAGLAFNTTFAQGQNPDKTIASEPVENETGFETEEQVDKGNKHQAKAYVKIEDEIFIVP